MSLPSYSAIIPTYNGARWLAQSINSVLRQTYPPAEIIVVNDGSSDETADVLAAFKSRIHCITREHGGIGATRNSGIAASSGAYVAFLDHDDLWQPEKLERQAHYLARHPEVDVLYTDATEFDARGTIHPSYFDLFPKLRLGGDLFSAMIHFHIPLMSTVCIRHEFLRSHNLALIEAASGVDDIGLFLEIAAHGGTFACLDEVLVSRRLHDSNLSKSHWNRFARRCVLYRELLVRLADAPPRYRRELHWGLRHAHYRVGEWWWERHQPGAAAEHFRQALGWDGVGLRARCWARFCLLPPWLAGSLHRCQRLFAKLLRRSRP
jgi:glycosyltransferase involved in cell wall biosynthesis